MAWLPMVAELRRSVADADGHTWQLVELERQVDYQLSGPALGGWKRLLTQEALIRSRWDGYEIGGAEPAAVFFFLVDPDHPVSETECNVEEHVSAGRAMCYPAS